MILLGFFCFSFFFFSFAELHARPRVSLSTFQTRPSLKKQCFEISKKKKERKVEARKKFCLLFDCLLWLCNYSRRYPLPSSIWLFIARRVIV